MTLAKAVTDRDGHTPLAAGTALDLNARPPDPARCVEA